MLNRFGKLLTVNTAISKGLGWRNNVSVLSCKATTEGREVKNNLTSDRRLHESETRDRIPNALMAKPIA